MSRSKKNLSRRELLKNVLAGSAAAALGPGAAKVLGAAAEGVSSGGAARGGTAVSGGIPRVVLGRTGERIPRLVQGTAMNLNLALLKRSYDLGVTYLDTADCYSGGNSEKVIGTFLEKTGLRKKIWITTKSDRHDPQGMVKTLRQSLQRLKTDHVELLFLHNMGDIKSLSGEMKQTVARLKKSGKIKYFGFSTHAPTVAEALHAAADAGWVDAIMFKYNFRAYGDDALNRAIDHAKQANIGLIAMKTQASAFSFGEKVEPFKVKGFTQHQAVLKAVWEDERIDAAVSHMQNVQQLEQNVAAARDRTRLGAVFIDDLHRYADATSDRYCRGCDHICSAALERPIPVADTLRYLMYHDEYGEADRARGLFRQLAAAERDHTGVDFRRASEACPYGLDVAALMERAHRVLA